MMPQPVAPYGDSREHVLAELGWLESLLQAEIGRIRSAPEVGRQDLFRGMYISDREVDRLTREEPAPPDAPAARVYERADLLRADVDARCFASAEHGVGPALSRLTALFSLTPFEERIVLAALAPEVDAKFGTLYAYLQDDATKRRPTVDLVIRLFTAPAQRLDALAAFSHDATLPRLRMVRGVHDGGGDPLPHRTIALDEPIVDLLLGTTGIHPDLAACVKTVPAQPLGALRWDATLRGQLLEMIVNFLQTPVADRRRLIVHLHGPGGTGKRTLAAALADTLGLPLLGIDLREMQARFSQFEDGIFVAFRQALLRQAVVFLEHFDAVTGDDEARVHRRGHICRAIDELGWLVFVGTDGPWAPGGLFMPHHCVSVELPPPTLVERRDLWDRIARTAPDSFAPDVDWDDIAVKFRITPGEMDAAIESAMTRARMRDPHRSVVTAEDLHRGLHAQSNPRLAALARRLTPRHDWPQLILPEHVVSQLHELCAHVRHRRTVFGDWGFERALSLGKGLCALFCGPPRHRQDDGGRGDRRRAAARGLFRIDLSERRQQVHRRDGEEPRRASSTAAESSNAILFFDEADALFGKRSEVKDAHDRYANIEISYLLQRIEEYDGVVILATNLRKNIDDGFFAAHAVRRRVPVPGRRAPACASGAASSRRTRRPATTWTSPSSRSGSTCRAATSRTSWSTRRFSPPTTAG